MLLTPRFNLFYTDPPVVSLSLGSNLEASDIKEGDDVYFECNMTANPSATKVTWKKDVRNLYPCTHLNRNLPSILETFM